MADDLECPRCRTTKYRNPSLKLMVNVCGHALCENCVELLFVRGSGACPQCNVALRRTNFRVQIFENPTVEKEVDIRKKILKDFNKKEEDFDSLQDYNNYLEMVEVLIYNLANGIDVEQTNKRIDKYRAENKDQIKKNRTKLSREEEYLEELIEIEKEINEKVRQEAMEEELNARQIKQRNKQMLLDKLTFSTDSADQILASHKYELNKQAEAAAAIVAAQPKHRPTQFSTGIAVGKQEILFGVPKEVGVQYTYVEPVITFCGPEPPEYDTLDPGGYLKHIRDASEQDIGGGYHSSIGCFRALQEAFSGLYYSHDSSLQKHVYVT